MAVKNPIANYSGTLKELQSGDTLPLSFAAQTAATFFAGPVSGSAATPTFRAISMSDLGTGTPSSSNFLRGDGSWQTVSASPAGSNTQIQFNSSGSFGASSRLTFASNRLTVGGGSSTASATSLFLDKADGFDPSSENRLDFGQGSNVYSRIANYYDGGTGVGLKFYTATTGGGLNASPSLTLKGDGSVEFSLTNGQTISKLSNNVLTLQNKTSSGTASRTSLFLDHDCGFSSGEENRLDFGQGSNVYGRIANHYDGTGLALYFTTWNGSLNGSPALVLARDNKVGIGTTSPSASLHVIATTEQSRLGYDSSNYFSTTVGSSGGVTFDAVGSGAKFTFSDSIEVADAKDIVVGTSTGTKIGTSTSQKLGFFNATPVTQRADIGALTDSTGGTPGTTIQDVGGAFDQDTLNDNFASLAAQINALRTEQRDLGFMA